MPWYRKWRNVFRDEALSTELDAELAHHLAETADRLIEQGVPEAEALMSARQRLGNYNIQKERTRDMNLATWLDQLRADAVYGIRQLKRSPGFTAVAVLSLGLGIGANTAIFALANQVLLKNMAVPHPERLRLFTWVQGREGHVGHAWGSFDKNDKGEMVGTPFPYPLYQEMRRHTGVCDVSCLRP